MAHLTLTEHTALGKGIYSVGETARLTGVSPNRIRRWLRGYSFQTAEGQSVRPPVLQGEFAAEEMQLQLSFHDMLELRVIDAFLRFGIPWKEIRRVASAAADILGSDHPFISHRFRTDGRKLFVDVVDQSNNKQLVHLADRQQVFRGLVEPYLKDLDFENELPVRWHPLGARRKVVIDPMRSFGRPVALASGVPTEVLARHAALTSIDETAEWYLASAAEVRDSIRYEQTLAA